MTGLGALAVLDRFAAECRRIQRLGPADRLDALRTTINDELVRASVPAFLHVQAEQLVSKGQFLAHTWTFQINRELIDARVLSDADTDEMCNTSLHEARHAEQHFLAARFQAEQGRTVAQIVSEMQIPQRIANEAHRRRLTGASAEVRDLARRMNQSQVTDGAANQAISDDVLRGIQELDNRRNAALAALAALRANATPTTIASAESARDALRAQIAEVRRRYTRYRNIPYEADAHEVGDAAEQAFRGWR